MKLVPVEVVVAEILKIELPALVAEVEGIPLEFQSIVLASLVVVAVFVVGSPPTYLVVASELLVAVSDELVMVECTDETFLAEVFVAVQTVVCMVLELDFHRYR